MSKFLDHLTPHIIRMRRSAERNIRTAGKKRKICCTDKSSHRTESSGYDWFNYPLTGKYPK